MCVSMVVADTKRPIGDFYVRQAVGVQREFELTGCELVHPR